MVEMFPYKFVPNEELAQAQVEVNRAPTDQVREREGGGKKGEGDLAFQFYVLIAGLFFFSSLCMTIVFM